MDKNKTYLEEAFKALEDLSLNEDVFELTTDGLEDADNFMNMDFDEVEDIIDVDAKNEEELKDSYIGNVILDCNVCHSKLYKKPEEVIIDEETEVANIEEACPYCQSNDGYLVIGQVAEYCDHCEDEEEHEEESEEVKNSIDIEATGEKGFEATEKAMDTFNDRLEESKKKRLASFKKTLREDWDWDGDLPKIANEMIKSFRGMDFISRDDFDEQFALACREVLGIDNIWENETIKIDGKEREIIGDVELDLRTILALNGYETIFEGENEGGLKLLESSTRDKIDADKDNKIEKARKTLSRKLDDADSLRDERRKTARKDYRKTQDDADSDRDYKLKRKGLKEAQDVTDQVIINTNEDGFLTKKRELEAKGYKRLWAGDGKICMAKPKEIKEDLEEENQVHVFEQEDGDWNDIRWYFEDGGLNGKDGGYGLLIIGNRDYTPFLYTGKYDETPIKDAYNDSENDEEFIAKLKEITGKDYKRYTLTGYSQSDWQDAYYPVGEFDKDWLEEIGDAYFGNYTVFYDTTEDVGGYIVFDSDKRNIKEVLSERSGVPVENIKVRKITGYHQVPNYMEESCNTKKSRKSKKALKESDKPAATSIEDAQKWVDYDMKKYGKISERTNRLVKKAGFQILKDDHGDYEVAAGKFESCNEDFERVDIETDREKMSMTSDENGKVTVTTEPKEEVKEEKEEVIEPVSDEVKAEFKTTEEENKEDEYADIDIDEFDEEEFDSLGEQYLKRVYENVKSFKTTKGSVNGNNLKLEGIITFKSGKEAKTNFVFESKTVTKTGKLKFIGENKQFAKGKKSFTLTGRMDGNKLVTESFTYNYKTKDPKSGEMKKLYGRVVR